MNETRSHFIAVCPKCSASRMVDIRQLGESVCCDHCKHTFHAGGKDEAATQRSSEHLGAPASQSPDRVDRIAAVCPGCGATLNIRRSYIGHGVRCNHCSQTFLVGDPAKPQHNSAASDPETISMTTLPPPKGALLDRPEASAERRQLRTKHDRLQGEHEQLQVAYNLLEVDYDRLQAERDRLSEDLGRVTAELTTVRDELGTSSSELQAARGEIDQLRTSLAQREQTMREERDRLRAEFDSFQPTLELDERAHHANEPISDSGGTAQTGHQSPFENGNPIATRPSSDAELKVGCADIEILKRRLQVLERLNREMSAVLGGMGIRNVSATSEMD